MGELPESGESWDKHSGNVRYIFKDAADPKLEESVGRHPSRSPKVTVIIPKPEDIV